MEPAASNLSLVAWQGWGVFSVIAGLTALLATILIWLLPFPDRSLDKQLANFEDRMAIKARLGAAPAFSTYLQTVRRLNIWLMEWFGPAFSGQAFERCLAIAFIFPITLFLLTLVTHGIQAGQVFFSELLLFTAAFTVVTYVMAAAFGNLLKLIERTWRMFGGDSELAQTIARVLLGAFAVMVAFTIAFAIASTFSGQAANAGSVLGAMAGGFALAFAFAVAFALAGAALFAVVVAIVGGAALAFASEFAFLLFLFFILLPIVNASVDWLSWGITRHLLRFIEPLQPRLADFAKLAGITFLTFVVGTLLMVALSALLPNAIEGLNRGFALAGFPQFDWRGLVRQAAAAPWSDGLFITGMLMTTIVPACTHLVVGLTGVLARFTPGAATAAEGMSDHPDVSLTAAEVGPVKITVTLSRIWYLAAMAVTTGLIAAVSAIIYYTHAPVAQFLSQVALCATSWSHGQCGWH